MSMVRVSLVEEWRVRPKPPPPTSESEEAVEVPLTFLDIPWLLFPPANPLFFYQLPEPPHQQLSSLLALSLSSALSLFYPLAGTLHLPPEPHPPSILCRPATDSVSFTVAHSDADFHSLSSYARNRRARDFRNLLPDLAQALMAVRLTVFPNRGFCLGFALHHAAADARTFNNFMTVWSSLCNHGMLCDSSLALHYDRAVIADSGGLKGVLLKEWWQRQSHTTTTTINSCSPLSDDMLRATFVVSPEDMERVKSGLVAPHPHSPLYLSPYVLTCSLLWPCLLKAQHHSGSGSKYCYFGFVAGGLTRLGYPVPPGYVGNCVGFGRAEALRGELLGEEGVAAAARAIGREIERLKEGMLWGAERWMSEWESMDVTVTGSPKVDFYARDFGWGRPRKVEELEIDATKAISLTESRDVKGGIEVGLVLPTPQMDAFTVFFHQLTQAP